MKKIKIPTIKTQKLAANLYFPKKKTKKLAILCPGYLHSKDYKHIVFLAESLKKSGYTVVSFDPLGTWASDGRIGDYTVTQYILDIQTVLDFMFKKKSYDHVLLAGHSRGGAVSIISGSLDPRISMVVSIMPSPLKRLSKTRYKKWKKDGIEICLRQVPGSQRKKEFHVPFAYVNDRGKYLVTKYAKKLKIPLVLVSGENDDQVSFSDIHSIFTSTKGPKQLIKAKGVRHNYWENSKMLNQVTKLVINAL